MIKKDETLKLKNELEKVRFSKDVIDNPNLVRILDRTIDQAENNDSALYIGSRLYYQLQQYEFAKNFNVPKVIHDLQATLAGYAGQSSSSMT